MRDFKATVITCTPSYALFMAEEAEKAGIMPRTNSWRIGIFGAQVLSPMVSVGNADFLVVLEETQIEPNRPYLGPHGVLLLVGDVNLTRLPPPKTVNTAMIGLLHVPGHSSTAWQAALRAAFPEKLLAMNEQAFAYGMECGSKAAT